MKQLLTLLVILVGWPLSAQQPAPSGKGVSPIPKSEIRNPNSTRAVVVGISDYREPLIPDLQFADRDAEAFATWLRSPAGGSLPDSNIVLLKNEKATNIQMIVSLDWLIEASRPGDRAFIYFSGHGDVERVTKFQRGFLLGYDSPPAVYGAGAFSLNYLQDILTNLAENEVQVFIVTDACRAGKLAGSSVNGSQVTAAQLSQQFANEIKILSCQPDELSLEGDQWGGGRGCFSYHLEDALYGFADNNADASVDLRELRRYLEDHVSAEAAPQNQTPIVTGPVQIAIAQVQEAALTAWKAGKGSQPVPFRDVENRGMEALLLAKADTSVQRLYKQFLAAIEAKRLMSPPKGQAPDSSANDYFNLLVERPEAATLRGSMKRKFAAALIEEGQTIINKVLQTDPQVLDNIWANRVNYDHLPGYFERAAEILGEKHYVWRDLKAKEFYFRAKTIREENYPDSSENWRNEEKRRLLERSIELDSTSAVVFVQLGITFPWGKGERATHFKKALELAPDWAMMHYWLGLNSIDPKEAIAHYKKALEKDSTFLRPCYPMTWLMDELGHRDSAAFWRQKYLDIFFKRFAEDSASLKSVECEYAGLILWRQREFEKAKAFLLRGEALSAGKAILIYGSLAVVLADLLDFENAIKASEKRGWDFEIGKFQFYFLNDTANAFATWSKEGVWVEFSQVQAWLTVGNFAKAHYLAKKNILPDKWEGLMTFYIAESARQLGMEDTARLYFSRILEKELTEFIENWVEVYPDYLIRALACSRLGKTDELRKLLETADEKLKGDPFHHFGLACIHAQTGQENAAIASLQKAISLGWQPNPLHWLFGTLCDPLLNPIRETEAYKALVREHFPKYYDIATRVPGRG